MGSIAHLIQKIKGAAGVLERKDIYVALIIIFVGLAGFGLGHLSAIESSRPKTQVYGAPEQTAAVSQAQSESADGLLVASKNGTKYHFPWCSGAQRIKEENKIWFQSKEEAERAGYEPAANCKGL